MKFLNPIRRLFSPFTAYPPLTGLALVFLVCGLVAGAWYLDILFLLLGIALLVALVAHRNGHFRLKGAFLTWGSVTYHLATINTALTVFIFVGFILFIRGLLAGNWRTAAFGIIIPLVLGSFVAIQYVKEFVAHERFHEKNADAKCHFCQSTSALSGEDTLRRALAKIPFLKKA